jgi:dihydroxyacetone kinase DhaKLM complex PTS-EIIA-like component DhaM
MAKPILICRIPPYADGNSVQEKLTKFLTDWHVLVIMDNNSDKVTFEVVSEVLDEKTKEGVKNELERING